MAAVTAAAVGAAGVIGGSVIANKGAKSAAKSQSQAADAATAEQARQFDEAQALQAPFREFGESFLGDLDKILSGETDLLDDPALQSQLDDATRTIDNRASHAGKFFQPRTTEALLETRDNIIRNNRTSRLNELFGAVNIGQNTAVNQANQGIAHGNSQADLLTQKGNAISAGQIASSNATADAIGGVSSIIGSTLTQRANSQAVGGNRAIGAIATKTPPKK